MHIKLVRAGRFGPEVYSILMHKFTLQTSAWQTFFMQGLWGKYILYFI